MPIYQSEIQRKRLEDINMRLKDATFLYIDVRNDSEFAVFEKDGKELILSSNYFKGDGDWFTLQ